jgi:hypothetical protein
VAVEPLDELRASYSKTSGDPANVGSLTQEFKKSYIDEKFTASKRRKKYADWDKLMEHCLSGRNKSLPAKSEERSAADHRI